MQIFALKVNLYIIRGSTAAFGWRSLPGRLRIPPDGGTDALKTSGDRGEAQAPEETTTDP
jgi:hypothetical protein